MKLRTLALALVFACGLTSSLEARAKKAQTPKRTFKAQKYKAPKHKAAKSPKVRHHA